MDVFSWVPKLMRALGFGLLKNENENLLLKYRNESKANWVKYQNDRPLTPLAQAQKHLRDAIGPAAADYPATRRATDGNPMLALGGAVNHPNHYNVGKIEVIDAIEDWKLGFNPGNAVKYIARHEFKGDPIENLEKAKWYIDREIARLKAK